MNTSSISDVNDDFLLSGGGRLYQLLKRIGNRQRGGAQVAWRVVVLILIGWVPLLLLSLVNGLAFGNQVAEPLLHDLNTNIRSLVVVPLLIIADVVVDPNLAGVIKTFVNSDLMAPGQGPRFQLTLNRIARLRDSPWVEAVLLVAALIASYQIIRIDLHDGRSSWLATISGTAEHITIAGLWYGLVSGPIQRFLLYRWLWRLLLWCGLLCRISRLNLHLIPTHPDRAAGLMFFGYGQISFAIVVFAAGTIVAAQIGEQIIWQSAELNSYKTLIVGYIVLCVALILGPLLVFSTKLWAAKLQGLREYGVLGQKYTQSFDKKWIIGQVTEAEPLLGTADIQSLADLGNSYEIISEMKIVPVNRRIALGLLGAAVAPILPLLLFRFSLEDLFLKILNMLE